MFEIHSQLRIIIFGTAIAHKNMMIMPKLNPILFFRVKILATLLFSICILFHSATFARSDDPIHNTMVKLQSVYWDEVNKLCRNELGTGTIVLNQDTEGREHYAVLTAAHVSQGANIEGWISINSKKTKLLFKSGPRGVGSPGEQSACLKDPLTEQKLIRLANNDTDLELIELERLPEGARYFKYIRNAAAYCIDFDRADSAGMAQNDSSYLSTSSLTLSPLNLEKQNKTIPFSTYNKPADELLSHYSLQLGPRKLRGVTDANVYSKYGKTFDSLVVNGMSGSPNFYCNADKPSASTKRCCIDGIVKAFHRYFPKSFTSTADEINELGSLFFNNNQIGHTESSTRWSYKDGNTVLIFEKDGIHYEEMNRELRNSGGGETADGGDTDQQPITKRTTFLPGILENDIPILGYELEFLYGRFGWSYYANRDSVNEIELLANIGSAKLKRITYPAPKGTLVRLLEARLKNIDSELLARVHRQLTELRRVFDDKSQIPEDDYRACFIDANALKNDKAEIRIKLLSGISNGESQYIFLRASSDGVLNAVYDPGKKTCNKIEVKASQSLFPIKIPNRSFGTEIQVSILGLFFNDLLQTDGMIARSDQRVFWINATGVPPADLYSRTPYLTVQLGKNERDWIITCYPDNSFFNSEFPSDLDFQDCTN